MLEDGDGHICGGLNAFPYDVFFTSTPDELLTADRLSTVASLSEMEEGAAGSYYINMIAVAPEARGLGFG